MNKWALITGASKGLGFNYAQVLLNLKYNIICVSRSSGYEKQFDNPHQKEIKVLNYDLSQESSYEELYQKVANINITLVINNAGFGYCGKFLENDLKKELNMNMLNMNCLLALTKLFMQKFNKKQDGLVINIASMGGFLPGPLMANYFATKSYVRSLTKAINYEMRKLRLKPRALIISPGTLKTNFWNRSVNQEEYHTTYQDKKLTRFCRKSLKLALRKRPKTEIIVGIKNKGARLLNKIIPEKIQKHVIYNYMNKKQKKLPR